jgi:hypothetical protein
MKKFIKKIQEILEKKRIVGNIWALWRQVKLREKITDKFEEDIEILQKKVNNLEFFLVDKPLLDKELQKLRQEAEIERETLKVDRSQLTNLCKQLVA